MTPATTTTEPKTRPGYLWDAASRTTQLLWRIARACGSKNVIDLHKKTDYRMCEIRFWLSEMTTVEHHELNRQATLGHEAVCVSLDLVPLEAA